VETRGLQRSQGAQYQKAGNAAVASKEKSLAAAACKKHLAQGNRKYAEPEPAICQEAAAV
jgi:hypothetical protein